MNEIILFTEGHQVTLQQYIHTNTAPDVDAMSKADILNLFALQVGESTMSGMLTVKRIA
jgi:hypothetical protein